MGIERGVIVVVIVGGEGYGTSISSSIIGVSRIGEMSAPKSIDLSMFLHA